MCSPTGMTDTDMTVQRMFLQYGFQISQSPLLFGDVNFFSVKYSDSGGIISSVFETAQSVNKEF